MSSSLITTTIFFMKLDLLKKLTRLANNNPNDNEANLAARKVCRMLEEANFVLEEDVVSNYSSKKYNGFGKTDDFHSDIFSYFYRNTGNNKVYKQWEKQKKQARKTAYNPFQTPPIYYSPFTEQSKPVKEKRILRCKTCKEEKETIFVGHPSVFECNNCQWTAYAKTKI